MNNPRYFRSADKKEMVIGLSVGYHPAELDDLLARGLGLEHLREMVNRLARPLLRKAASIAYGGNWQEESAEGDNFTYVLLRIISAELEDNSIGGPDTNHLIGALYNHSAWPNYLKITPRIEAQWITCCRIIRITQQMVGFNDSEIVPDEEASDEKKSDRCVFNAAATLSKMRQLVMGDLDIGFPDPKSEKAPGIAARVLIGGIAANYTGFLPGIFEEALLAFESQRPMFILGGFGGASEILAEAVLQKGSSRPPQFTEAWHFEHNPRAARLSKLGLRRPPGILTTGQLLDKLFDHLCKARVDPVGTLQTGLTHEETLELMKTRNVSRAVKLVLKGLKI